MILALTWFNQNSYEVGLDYSLYVWMELSFLDTGRDKGRHVEDQVLSASG